MEQFSQVEPQIEIIQPVKRSYGKYIGAFVALAFLALVIFFSVRAYTVAKRVMVARSSNASPLLVDDIEEFLKDPGFISNLKEGDRRVNILLLGVGGGDHPGAELTDTMLVVSIDVKNKAVAMLSIPRDLYVPVKGYSNTKINSVYTLGLENNDNNIQKAFELVKGTISDVFDVPIHYLVLVDFEGFQKAIDAIGGIGVEVQSDIYDSAYPDKNVTGYEPFSITRGYHILDGETALKYARSRHGSSDFDRARRQQEILTAVKEKMMEKDNIFSIKKINDLVGILSDNIKTDLQLSEIDALYKIAKGINKENIATKVLDDSSDSPLYADSYDGMYVLVPNDPSWDEVKEFIRQYFKDPFTASEKAKISIKNGTTTTGLGTKLAEQLKIFGYDIVDISNADDKKYESTFIYDYSNNGKKNTLKFLQEKLNNAPVVRLDDKASQWDIEIIIGKDYKSIK